MKTSIITANINNLQFIELRGFMQRMIEESIRALDSHDSEHLMWYEDCTMDDYFQMWTEIWDEEDNYIGEGLDTISHKFVLNEDTRAYFEHAFDQARDAAFETAMQRLGEEIEGLD